VARLTAEIEATEKEVAENITSLQKAEELRKKQSEEFHSEEKDLLGMIFGEMILILLTS
jgi:hypothetical protein